MHHVSRQLSIEDLAALFEGRTRFVERLASRLAEPAARGLREGRRTHLTGDAGLFAEARGLLHSLPEDEQVEALNAHPAIGARGLSTASAREQGNDGTPKVLEDLARLNRAYEEKFGFRFVVFVNRRPKAEILRVLRERFGRSREEELSAAIDELVAIAEDRRRRLAAERSRRA